MALTLSFEERRVLGTLVEKAHTTPEQCPLTLNSLVSGCNQKSCRAPLTSFTEETVLGTLESLREKGLAVLVRSSAGRVDRWRQSFAEGLELSPKETAVLTELLLRGAQTDGELRQRATRMVRIESLDEVGEVVHSLSHREPPLVARTTPAGKRRGVKYDHLLYPERERQPVASGAPAVEARVPPVPSELPAPQGRASREELAELRREVADLRDEVTRLADRVRVLEAGRGD